MLLTVDVGNRFGVLIAAHGGRDTGGQSNEAIFALADNVATLLGDVPVGDRVHHRRFLMKAGLPFREPIGDPFRVVAHEPRHRDSGFRGDLFKHAGEPLTFGR